ncbi:unnamed protein product [Microthlaspi erraticum]|uniref:Uncharacterized protein n=1 Tax=Microthlaspi erraticum TaxID=1685480 RepID=A0A6D2JSB8_9BRAS|nr:unnamed protein product [Microthlaspi erraticum]
MRIWVSLSATILRSMRLQGCTPLLWQPTRELDFSKARRRSPRLPPRSKSLLTTPRRLPAHEPHRASSFEPREGEDNSQRRRKSSKTRRSNSISELDRAEGRVDLEEPLFENLGFEYDSTQYQDFSQTLWTPYNCFEQAQLLQGQGSHTHFNDEEEEKRSLKLDRVSRTQSSGVFLMAVYHPQTTT